ncbi:MAG TPA: circularly permuted type 2 ATP-grasp protein [Longimicrobium sp.]|jgi:uncharacterized circularly permuted ATP-grasp superfamily protein
MTAATGLFAEYRPVGGVWDELFQSDRAPHDGAAAVVEWLGRLSPGDYGQLRAMAASLLREQGLHLSFADDSAREDRDLLLDLIPRPIGAGEWERTVRGLEQRVRALNLFLADVYSRQRILGELPELREVVRHSRGFVPEAAAIRPPGGVHVHIAGPDLVRTPQGELTVLEDNLCVPSGIAEVLAGRDAMRALAPPLMARHGIRAMDDTGERMRASLVATAPPGTGDPYLVVLSQGRDNEFYAEHHYLARITGAAVVTVDELVVQDGRLYHLAPTGPVRVDVVYRRIDDVGLRHAHAAFFRELLGVCAAGRVTLANAVGNAVGDQKSVFAFVPEMIRFYLAEEPLLPQIPTFLCAREADRGHVLANMASLVIKHVRGAGGRATLVGPQASRAELDAVAARIREKPHDFVAQPLVEISTCPTWAGAAVEPRRVDLRPFVFTGHSTWVMPGGLSRVALRPGSYVVNRAQGGGAKDTWVLAG